MSTPLVQKRLLSVCFSRVDTNMADSFIVTVALALVRLVRWVVDVGLGWHDLSRWRRRGWRTWCRRVVDSEAISSLVDWTIAWQWAHGVAAGAATSWSLATGVAVIQRQGGILRVGRRHRALHSLTIGRPLRLLADVWNDHSVRATTVGLPRKRDICLQGCAEHLTLRVIVCTITLLLWPSHAGFLHGGLALHRRRSFIDRRLMGGPLGHWLVIILRVIPEARLASRATILQLQWKWNRWLVRKRTTVAVICIHNSIQSQNDNTFKV